MDIDGYLSAHARIRVLLNRLMEALEAAAGVTTLEVYLADIHREMIEHFDHEEAHGFPAARSHGWAGGSVVHEFDYHHHLIRRLMEDARASLHTAPERVLPLAEELRRRVHEHFETEETALFPIIEVARR
ncbi:protein of unknown function [Candidatus Hydrogenisulfobacillus filiaventi]|uniref:Hemerythrin-like domain-containing protein n=1 Tax=Candidatus Hydrogenisulfobacillus filiaventi TaxID=2707344 RepID=A0A6F8ZC30_9FIRM|nr:hemerythrin domain-containing protein [Bacillota bacterium]CAB1127586.1 protein of unknown function [Candidatus Hydrogenisulfobacillus filiaventi]